MARLTSSGVVVIDKPRGPTSHDVVARVRKKLGTREVGHAGTLDPMATGVLVIAVGEATKLVPWLTASAKTYTATLALGIATDTLDAEGAETARASVPPDARARLPAALAIERARTSQIPPMFSAIHVSGERAHERVRRGEEIELAPREVLVRSLRGEIVGTAIELELTVSKGYYVRALARDLAAALGTVGHLTALRRTRAGAFDLSEAQDLDGELTLRSLGEAAASALPVATLTTEGARRARHGQLVPTSEIWPSTEGPHAWFEEGGPLIAVGEIGDDGGRVIRGFRA